MFKTVNVQIVKKHQSATYIFDKAHFVNICLFKKKAPVVSFSKNLFFILTAEYWLVPRMDKSVILQSKDNYVRVLWKIRNKKSMNGFMFHCL